MALRFFTGASQGFVSPAMQSLWSHWAPPLESSRLRSICFAGSQVGKVLTYPMTALLCEYGFDGGWPSLFYLQGIVGVVWFVGWCLTVYDSPSQHPRISARERDYIETSLAGMVSGRSQTKTPWLSILGSGPVWAIIIAHMCCNWGEYTFLTNIPTYMKEVLKFDIKQNGFLSALPYLGFWLLITVSSWLADLVRSKQLLSTTATRKLFNSVGKFVPALLLIAVSFVDCTQPYLAVSLLALGVSMTGFQYGGGLYMSAGDIAPMYAGVIYGISNTVATIPGFLSPLAIGLLTPDQTQEQWRQVFYIAAAIYVFGAIFFIVFSSGDLQTWAKQEMQEAASLELKVDLLDSEACGVAKQEMQEAASLELKVDLLDSEACGVGTDTPRDRRHIEPCDTDIRSIEASDRNTHDIDLTDTNTHNIDHSDTNTHDIDPSDTNTHDIDPSDTNTHNIDSSDTKTHIIDPSDTNTHDIDPSDTNAHNRDHSDTNTH
ncbi:sialin-like isoform X2 [Physella acuta]|uniref:sialin-like isoform X2 n=1 Tax=Physella acuta TaxID=109671 RepID=UPI0027DD8F7C|nr:sialin-like isoform X2 [Physella acuta]